MFNNQLLGKDEALIWGTYQLYGANSPTMTNVKHKVHCLINFWL